MFHFSFNAIKRAYFSALFAILALFVPVAVHAQGGVGSTRGLPESSSGIHSIQGRVYLPSGQRAGPGIAIRLEGNVVGSRRSSTDLDGTFMFHSLPASDYSLVIEGGPDYEPIRESVTIYGNTGGVGMSPSGQTIMLDIHLRPKGAAAAGAFPGVPRPAVDSYKKGMEFVRSGDSKKAIEQFSNALATYPRFPEALNELGLQYRKLTQWDKARETFEELLKLKPNDADVQTNLGMAFFNLKKFDEAEIHLRESVKLNGKIPTGHYYLGLTLVALKRYADAQTEFELAITNGGENLPQAHKYLGGIYMSTHRNKEAADELEKYLKLDPKAADAERIRTTVKELRSKP
ncbi:MAG: tetratricopeptide repeat protein [Acidobacteriota bacterium]